MNIYTIPVLPSNVLNLLYIGTANMAALNTHLALRSGWVWRARRKSIRCIPKQAMKKQRTYMFFTHNGGILGIGRFPPDGDGFAGPGPTAGILNQNR
jgi:hypothetical protein